MSKVIQGDCLEVLKTLPDASVDCCITSPPYYGLRDYGTGTWEGGDPNCPHRRTTKKSDKTITGHAQAELESNVGDAIYKTVCPICGAIRVDKQIGLEETPEDYTEKLVAVFREVRRVLKDDGTLWLNLGDSYFGGAGRGGDAKLSDRQRSNKGAVLTTRNWKHDEIKQKDLIGIPWLVAFALRQDGWYLRQDIIWHKPNPMPESVKDRCTKSHEYIFLLSKSPHYYFDYQAIQEDAVCSQDPHAGLGRISYGEKRTEDAVKQNNMNESFVKITEKRNKRDVWQADEHYKNLAYNGQTNHSMHERRAEGLGDVIYERRNKRDVWSVSTKPTREAHFATFPEDLIAPCVLAGCPKGGVVLDPFFGSGTTGRVATRYNREYIGIELNPEYIDIIERRTDNVQMDIMGFLGGDANV